MATTEREKPAATAAPTNSQPAPAAKEKAEKTVQIGTIEVGLPPDPSDPISVSHYLTANMNHIWRLAQTFANSGLVPKELARNPEGVFTILSLGLELGLGYATALRTIYTWNGRPTLSADLLMGLAMSVGTTFTWEKNDADGARLRWKRGESTGVEEFTIEDAKRAGLLGKDNWKNYPGPMCVARVGSRGARKAAPDRVAGLYTLDELQNDPELVATTPALTIDRTSAIPVAAQLVKGEPSTTGQHARIWAQAREAGLVERVEIEGEPHDRIVSPNATVEALAGGRKIFKPQELSHAQADAIIATFKAGGKGPDDDPPPPKNSAPKNPPAKADAGNQPGQAPAQPASPAASEPERARAPMADQIPILMSVARANDLVVDENGKRLIKCDTLAMAALAGLPDPGIGEKFDPETIDAKLLPDLITYLRQKLANTPAKK